MGLSASEDSRIPDGIVSYQRVTDEQIDVPTIADTTLAQLAMVPRCKNSNRLQYDVCAHAFTTGAAIVRVGVLFISATESRSNMQKNA